MTAQISTRAEKSGQDARMARIRERLATTTESERQLRVMLVLAHEALRASDSAAIGPESNTAQAPATSVALDDYQRLIARIHDLVGAAVPAGANILVMTRGDDALLVPGFTAAHFPQGRNGGYAGFYPRDSAAAIAHLEECRADGAEFLVVPATAYWWLEYYEELARHLLIGGRVAHHDEHCLICDLRLQEKGAPTT